MKKLFLSAIIVLFFYGLVSAEPYNRDKDFGTWQHHHGISVRQEMANHANIDGKFLCPYTGEWHDIKTAQADHVIPTAWAYRHGADKWTHAKRVQFYNDPQNLILVYGPINEAKGDSPPDQWLPPRKEFRAQYLAAWVTVCRVYDLDCDYGMLSKMIGENL